MIHYKKEPMVQDVFNIIRTYVGLSHSESRNMLDVFAGCLAFGHPVVSIAVFSEWMESKYPEYLDSSIKSFLQDKDPGHADVWEWLFGIRQWDASCDSQVQSLGFSKMLNNI